MLASVIFAISGSAVAAPVRTWFFDWIPDSGSSTGFLELIEPLPPVGPVDDPANTTILNVLAGEFNFNEGLFTETFDVLYFQEGNPSLGTVTSPVTTENGLITDIEIRGGAFNTSRSLFWIYPTVVECHVRDSEPGYTTCGNLATDANYDAVVTGVWQLREAVVPIPAAGWLFGSGLIGLIGLARRIKA
jgi:hypothetical protein